MAITKVVGHRHRAFTLLWLFASATLVAAEQTRPNVLFLIVDDLRPQLGCYGHAQMKTPQMDSLAASGALFLQSYCQVALCSPSRTSVLTGLRPDSTQVYGLTRHFRSTHPDLPTLPQYFKQNGYNAVGLGKVYHPGLNDELSWSRPWRGVEGHPYQRAENQERVAARRAQAVAAGLSGTALFNASRGPATEAADVADGAYPDGWLADQAIAVLREEHTTPFFLAVGFVRPHLPFNCPVDYWEQYDPKDLLLPKNRRPPQGAPRLAGHLWEELRAYTDIPQSGALDGKTARRLLHGYYACTSYVDAQVGRILAELSRRGLDENTIVILWGDHGWHLLEQGLWCKHTNFDVALRSPLLIRAPGFQSGLRIEALTELVDLYPSLCELAGLPLPDHLEGTSFVPLLRRPERSWKSAVFSQYLRAGHMGYSMKTAQHHFILWQNQASGRNVALELYDHEQDPGETLNLAHQVEQRALVQKCMGQLSAGWRAALPE